MLGLLLVFIMSPLDICGFLFPSLSAPGSPTYNLVLSFTFKKKIEIVYVVKVMVFLVDMYRCESWTIKKAEGQRTNAFNLWCWRRLLSVSCTAGRSNQSILKEINPEYLLEGPMLKLKLQYFGHLMQRANSLEKT